MTKRICGNCGTVQGPFTLVMPTIRVCGPVQIEKETKKLIGRVVECNEKRKKQEIEKYGDAQNPYL